MASAFVRTVRLFRNPWLAIAWSTEFVDDRITTPRRRNHLDYYRDRQLSLHEGLVEATGFGESDIGTTLDALPEFLVSTDHDPGMTIRWSASSELAASTYAVIKLLKPEVVVETGVGAGVSSWTILRAMEENQKGRLISIDLPTPKTALIPKVGYLVPENLRHRWELRTGPAGRLLPQVLAELGTVDIFLHDSRHSYNNQVAEYEAAWPFIRPGGMLLSDDLNNDALYDVSRDWGQEPTVIGQSKETPIGLIRKK
jgi:predicted O-methyltransferase YrrM